MFLRQASCQPHWQILALRSRKKYKNGIPTAPASRRRGGRPRRLPQERPLTAAGASGGAWRVCDGMFSGGQQPPREVARGQRGRRCGRPRVCGRCGGQWAKTAVFAGPYSGFACFFVANWAAGLACRGCGRRWRGAPGALQACGARALCVAPGPRAGQRPAAACRMFAAGALCPLAWGRAQPGWAPRLAGLFYGGWGGQGGV